MPELLYIQKINARHLGLGVPNAASKGEQLVASPVREAHEFGWLCYEYFGTYQNTAEYRIGFGTYKPPAIDTLLKSDLANLFVVSNTFIACINTPTENIKASVFNSVKSVIVFIIIASDKKPKSPIDITAASLDLCISLYL
jgi:hypothetical protein